MTKSDEDITITNALRIMELRLHGKAFESCSKCTSAEETKQYLRLKCYCLEYEVFGVLWLDVKNRIIKCEDLFRGTVTQTAVYPREVVKSALYANASGAVLYHNHPSGSTVPSAADIALTGSLKIALALVDCRVLDHIIIAGLNVDSFAERGLIQS